MKDSTVSARAGFDVSVPKTMDMISDSGLDVKLQHSYEQSLAGEGKPYTEVFDALEARQAQVRCRK